MSLQMKHYLIDAKGKILGRVAAAAALMLSGKRKVNYDPHIDQGDVVVIINCDQIKVTGKKGEQKMYHYFSGYPGGIRSLSFNEKMKRDSRSVVQEAVAGMLPKNKLKKKMLKRLKTFKGKEHNLQDKLYPVDL